ncbi:MAG: polysaccharide deacetylase family protein [Clostridia bacterium]|nr:polysaccharide deacetylase family protein [Clostridia bacterium]
MSNKLTAKKRRDKNITTIVIVSAVLSAIAMILLFIFVINRWTVTVTLNGDDKIILEEGEKYEEPGAVAEAHGSVLFKTPHSLTVKTEGKVDSSVPGSKYTIKYTAKYLLAKGYAERTVVVRDGVAPVIELKTDPESVTLYGEEYVEEGYTAHDNVDGDITDKVTKTREGNIIKYTVEDSSGNVTTVERKINYKDVNPPVVTLQGDAEITLNAGDAFTDPGCTATDKEDGDISDRVTVEGTVNIYIAGTYTLKYTVKDAYGNAASAERTVNVKARPQAPSGGDGGEGRYIYLTFDDGPSQYTPHLLDVLAKYNVKVTFFVTNQNTDIITREFKEGHSVGIHTASHVYSEIYANDDAYFADFNKMGNIIAEKTGKRTTLMRFPGGSSNMVSKICPGIMTRLTKSVTDQGYQYFDWNVSSGDAGQTTSSEQVYQNVINGCNGRKNSVVLQHDTKDFSVNAVEKIINWGLANGYTFLPLTPSSPGMHHGVNN